MRLVYVERTINYAFKDSWTLPTMTLNAEDQIWQPADKMGEKRYS